MPSIAARIVAKVRAILPADWLGVAGRRFRDTVAKVAADKNVRLVMSEGAQRFAVGRVSHEHAEAVRNYAEEEKARIEAELSRRTMNERVRQEQARADQEEIRVRTMRSEELLARLKLFDELQRLNAVPLWDKRGNMHIIKPPASFDWERARAMLLTTEEVIMTTPDPEDGGGSSST